MKVLYDISVLGAGMLNPKARTGVFRVVESVAEELIKQASGEIVFCNNSSVKTAASSMQYLNSHPFFSMVPFSVSSGLRKRLVLHDRKLLLARSITHASKLSAFDRVWTKVQIRKLIFEEKLLAAFDDLLMDAEDVRIADIYHTPFYPLPDEVKKRKINKFVTSYDLIPILYPQFAQENVISLIHDVVNCLTPETWVLCISEATRTDLLNYCGNRVSPERVLVTHLAASAIFFQSHDRSRNRMVGAKYNIPDQPYILSLCTLEPRKNIEQVIKAFVKIVTEQRIQELNLVLVGTKGWMFNEIFEEIEFSKELRHRIILTGFLPDEDLAPIYSDALMFVYPTHYEGFGLPPLEAMKCGTPVITSNTSSLPEVVGDAGIMVSPTDLDSLCQAMLSLYNSESLCKEYRTRSLIRAEKFSWQRCAKETIAAYKAAIES